MRWSFLRFYFSPSIRNLLLPPTFAYISKITLIFFKQFKMSDSSNKTLQNRPTCKNQDEPPIPLTYPVLSYNLVSCFWV